jgi:hypothetical protein
MSSSAPEADVQELVLRFPLSDARQLEEVLPWVLQALADRPNLTPKQRSRRLATHAALDGVLQQVRSQLPSTPDAGV